MPLSVSTEPRATNKKPKRNAFVRTKVSCLERVISFGTIAIIFAIGVAIWIKGKHFDPNIYSLRTDALKSTESEVEGKSGTLRAELSQAEEGAAAKKQIAPQPASTKASEADAESSAAAKPPAAAKGEPLEIEGIKPMGDTEFYNAENLFEKIDGRAPAYLSFNFQQLRNRSFAVANAEGSYVDVYEYRFDTPINAFGMFALERDAKSKRLDFVVDGYSGEMGFFFRQGATYVQIIASDQNAKTMELARSIAENRAKALPANDAGLDARRRLPAEGLIPESVAFVQENAQGQAFLKNVFQAAYQFDGKKLQFFLMMTTPDAAAAAFKSYQTFCGRFGKVTVLPDENDAHIFQAESFGKCKVIYQRDGELGGVFDADDAEKAQQFVKQCLQGKMK